MKSLILHIDDKVFIDFGPIVEKWVEEDCRKEAKEIIKNINSFNELESQMELLTLYKFNLQKNGNSFCSHLDLLKWQLVKDGLMDEGGCFGATPD